MPRRNSTTEIKNGKVVFSKEVLSYFESIRTEENSIWINKYFEYLSDKENLSAEKYNIHHIRPCFTFKDENHKNRKQTKPLGDKFNGNLIKLSIYNHLFAHYCLLKIFEDVDSKYSFQRMCGQNTFDELSENELKKIAKLQEECAKYNLTDEEKKKRSQEREKKYRNSKRGKESQLKRSLKYYNNHKESESKRKKKYRETHKEEISQYWSEYYKNNKDEIYKNKKEYRKNNKEKCQDYNHEYYLNNREKALDVNKEYLSQECYDPKEENFCTLGALRGRKYRNKEKYKDVIPIDCVVKNQSLFPNISS